MDNLNQEGSKVIRIPSLKRGRDDVPLDDRVKLERVLGLTVGSNAALDCDPNSEQVAYPAGCTIVLFSNKKNKQTHILNSSRKTITCLAFSPGGKYLATGECGHVPSLRIWSVLDATQVAEFQGHKYGINCVAFSPNNKYVVSVGSQHDMIVNVWDWKNNVKVASNKVSTRVKAVSFAENGKYFVTVGMRHVKFWYLEYSRSAKYNEPVPLMGRSGILGEQRDNYFCDVACGRGEMGDSTYSITKSGLLCEFNIRRLLDKWVELRTRSANCMTVGEYFIFIGCADGIIRCFSPITLQFLVTLPRTHYLGVDVSLGLDISHLLTHPQDAKYPDAIALAYDETNRKLTCVYNDHSLYVWDVNDIKRVGKSQSFLYHSACIWGVEMYPEVESQESLPVPPGSFITCSSDDTIRVWNLNQMANNATIYRRNIYSNDLLKVLYVDKDLTYLKDLDLTTSSSEKTETSYDGKNGVRSVRISPDGQHLASGDREGNIRIHELRNLNQTVMIEAHDAEVLCLEYSKECGENLLASASRDRLIHVFNVAKGYECMQTLDDHSSSITAVRFINTRGQLQLVSCSADKSIIFRQFHPATPGGSQLFCRDHNVAGKTTLYDMEIDCGQKHIMTACQDRNIRVYNVVTGKHSKTFKGSMGEDGTLIKVSLDNSGIYVATSCTDKSLSVYDYYSGECMATMLGHSELVTGLRFTNDCKRLISASGDGCIFIWKLPRDMVVTMQARLDQQAVRRGKRTLSLHSGLGINNQGNEIISDAEDTEDYEVDPNANIDKTGFKFSLSKLPAWARREMEDPNKATRKAIELNESPEQPIHTGYSVIKVNKPPQGRWAQRIENNEIMIATFSPDKQKNINEPTSKDSSLESHPERNEDDLKVKELQGNEGVDFDGDVEDSDVETETHYYPVSNDINSEFTVNANNIEELRRSSRRYKKQQMKKARPNSLSLEVPGLTASNAGTSVSGSQESEDDDLEDISSETETPSIERAIGFSMNSVSTESLDLVGQRENYFKNNFESMHVDGMDGRKDASGKSITSQYLVRNTAVINAAKQTKSDLEKTKKREELKKRLEDTRRTLQISGMSPSPLKASQSICDLSRYPDRDQRSNSSKRFQPSQGKANKTVNLLTIFSYPTNKKPDFENEKSWISEKLTKNSKFYSKMAAPAPVSISEVQSKDVKDINPPIVEPDLNVSNGSRIKSTSLAYNHRPNLSNALYTTQNTTSLLKNNFEKAETKKGNLFYSFIEFENDSNFNRNDNRYSTYTKKPKKSGNKTVPDENTNLDNTSTNNSENDTRLAKAPLACNSGTTKVHDVVEVSKGAKSEIKDIPKMSKTEDAKYEVTDAKIPDESAKPDAEIAKNEEGSAKVEPEKIKRPTSLGFQKVYTTNLSLPDSPISESVSQISPVDNGHCFTDSEMIRGDEKPKKRSCSFYVDLKSNSDKRLAEKKQKEKERLLMAHDQIGLENSGLKLGENRSIESLLEEFEDPSDGEFSSDSLESESLGTKPPRRCVSDFQIFSKETRSYPRSLSLCSQQKSYNEELSDTDFSGLNSLQGSGDLLEMQENDCSDFERLDDYGRHSSASFFLNKAVYKSTESMLTDESEYEQIGRSIDNILDIGSHERIEKLFKSVENSHHPHQSRVVKKSDAFFIEFDESPRKHKPILRAKSLPAKRNVEKMSLGGEGLKTKPPTAPKPVLTGDKNTKVRQLAKKLSLKCNQQVLPSKITQDDDLDDEEGLRRAISLSDLSASTTPQSGSTQVSGKCAPKANPSTYNNGRASNRNQSMVRCSSVGVLNRADSETELNSQGGKKFGGTTGKGLMRPTISSQNKVTTTQTTTTTTGIKNINSGLAKRRAAAFSSVNLTTVGVNDDSSSEELGFGRSKASSDRNNASAGARRQSNIARYGSLKDLSHKAKEVTQRLTSTANTTVARKNKNQEVEKEAQNDVAAAPLTKQLCSSVSTQLSQNIDNLIALHKRLTLEVDKSKDRPQLQQMAEDLEKVAIETQQKLNSLTKQKNNNSIIRNQLSTNPSNFLGNNLGFVAPNNVTSAPTQFLTNSNNPNLMSNVDMSRFSEMLISVVQQITENQQNNQKN